MITEISIRGFKSLHDVERLSIGQFNLLIGPNASGKSNLIDAFRVLQGIGFGLTVAEIFDGKPKAATGESWEGIRGGTRHALHELKGSSFGSDQSRMSGSIGGESSLIELDVSMLLRISASEHKVTYSIKIDPRRTAVRSERLAIDGRPTFESIDAGPTEVASSTLRVKWFRGKGGGSSNARIDVYTSLKPILGQIPEASYLKDEDRSKIRSVRESLGDFQSLDPTPSELRKYSTATNVRRLGDRGENFAALVETISMDDVSRQALLGWLRELRPAEVDDVIVMTGAVGDRLFGIVEEARKMPATVLSDGTLRFVAIVAAFLQPDMPATMAIEEIENGIHASRMRLLIELLRTQTARTGVQVFATTHSPIVLAWLKPEEYRNVLWFKRDEAGATRITPLDQDPEVAEVLRKQPIAGLFAEGWLEGVM